MAKKQTKEDKIIELLEEILKEIKSIQKVEIHYYKELETTFPYPYIPHPYCPNNDGISACPTQ